jgi:hypothetical protein
MINAFICFMGNDNKRRLTLKERPGNSLIKPGYSSNAAQCGNESNTKNDSIHLHDHFFPYAEGAFQTLPRLSGTTPAQ